MDFALSDDQRAFQDAARAFALAIEAGRLGFEAGIMPQQDMAVPSTPVAGYPILL